MEAARDVRFLGDMTKLDLKPDDKLVLQLDRRVPTEEFSRIMFEMERIFGAGRVVVLDAGMKLGAVSMPEKAE